MRRRPSASATDEEDDHLDHQDHLDQSSNDVSPNLLRDSPPTRRSPHLAAPIPKKQQKPKRKNSRPADPPPPKNSAWKQQSSPSADSGPDGKDPLHLQITARDLTPNGTTDITNMTRRSRMRNPWAFSWLALTTLTSAVLLLLCLYQSFSTKQLDPKGGSMSYMASSFIKFGDFDTEHTRFATKYSLHLYRELGVDEDPRVRLG
jgi:GPI inositol-deacylase